MSSKDLETPVDMQAVVARRMASWTRRRRRAWAKPDHATQPRF